MAEIKWIKLSVTMFDDEKIKLIEAMPEADTIIVIWVKLLALAGRSNMGGYIMLTETIPYTEDMLVSMLNRPLSTIRMALATFQKFGMFELSDNGAFFLTNWEKHQNVDGMDKVRLQTNARVKKHRDGKKALLLEEGEKRYCNVTVTDGNATDIEVEVDLEIDKEKDNCCCSGESGFEIIVPISNNPNLNSQDAVLAGDADSDRDADELDYRRQVANLYLARRGKGLEISAKDEITIKELITDGVPIHIVLAGITKAFDNFKPQHRKSEIKSLSYCTGIIYDLHSAALKKKADEPEIKNKPVKQTEIEKINVPTEEDIQKMLAEMRSKRGGV
ncbi:phage replisome organizer N-terminal domain-containing protein [Paenibacillus graminis]|uniref:Phage replisome organiser N-terminal domain-containing protein n=1 Tax=Paenibacillus graminis TaxID=189425 RepID=A0A089M9E5_9BACL|nr:phage replisome organizer N-terminal domain-containing protein [Paenibacillus graminis]AIQ70396.1 hypothetical protein PGRAT_24255 [Paenibacillus graminis]MEC0170292.1 phage replisome organizer N-terminal domain-containing protein [Paenibacillus graminis]